MRSIASLPLALLFVGGAVAGPVKNQLNLMPWPEMVESRPAQGELAIQTSFAVSVPQLEDPQLKRAVEIFLLHLRQQTGALPLDFTVTSDPSHAQLRIECFRRGRVELGEDESYRLEVTPSLAELKAPTTLGVMRGLETFLQLVHATGQGFAAPSLLILDKPRFAWRGLMIDCSRHFMPIEVLKRNLDAMAALKLNVFHWGLSNDQGFRAESKVFPKLQELGSDGLYYTQEQMRDIVQYAAERGIRVVPEFDMPGHSTAWLTAYPELASAPGPYSIERRWGVFDPTIDPTRESTYKFLDKLVREMSALFPDRLFHIGGDEVNGKQWDQSPEIQRFMRAHGLKTNADLQAYFNSRLEKIVRRHGKIMEGWDEIFHPDLPKTVVIQSWRGQQSLADAARQGYRGLLSFGYYLDHMEPAAAHYRVDPLGDGAGQLSQPEKERILGGEACMWAEYVSPENIDSRIWPRTAAIAERLWSPANVTEVDSMYLRLEWISQRLDAYGLTHNSSYGLMLERMAEQADIGALRVLTDVVEPVGLDLRERLARSEPTSLTPLNRVVDAAQPESQSARRLQAVVEQFASGSIQPGVELKLRLLFSRWRDNRLDLEPLARDSSLVAEIMPLAESLSQLGMAGLEALDYLDRGEKPPDEWRAKQMALVAAARQPRAQVVLAIAAGIEKLIEASAQPKLAGSKAF
jgi:hexosaminidase